MVAAEILHHRCCSCFRFNPTNLIRTNENDIIEELKIEFWSILNGSTVLYLYQLKWHTSSVSGQYYPDGRGREKKIQEEIRIFHSQIFQRNKWKYCYKFGWSGWKFYWMYGTCNCDCFKCAVDGDRNDPRIALEGERLCCVIKKKNWNIFIAHFKLAFILGVFSALNALVGTETVVLHNVSHTHTVLLLQYRIIDMYWCACVCAQVFVIMH